LAYILDKICGLKGHSVGFVGLYKEQPLVFVNLGGATRKEVEKLKKEIEEKVFAKTKIKIIPEVTFIN